MRSINLIVIHCSATPDGVRLEKGKRSPDKVIDDWHKQRGFAREPYIAARSATPRLLHIGYHMVIDLDGQFYFGRSENETGAHVAGFNAESLGVCMIGTGKFTRKQWLTLRGVVIGKTKGSTYDGKSWSELYNIPMVAPTRTTEQGEVHVRHGICGHRDLSPDKNKNGFIEPFEWLKTCPGFNVNDWLVGDAQPVATSLLD
jgi:hypothetical protein